MAVELFLVVKVVCGEEIAAAKSTPVDDAADNKGSLLICSENFDGKIVFFIGACGAPWLTG